MPIAVPAASKGPIAADRCSRRLYRRLVVWLFPLPLVFGACAPDPETNESTAVATLRTLNTAEITYLTSNEVYGSLDDLADAGFVDPQFREGSVVAGYVYTTVLTADGSEYRVNGMPVSETTGRFGYYSGPDQVVRYASGPGVAEGDPVE